MNLTNYDITFNEEDTEVRMKNEKAKTDYMKLFKKYDNEFINALCKQFCSIYSETLKQFI